QRGGPIQRAVIVIDGDLVVVWLVVVLVTHDSSPTAFSRAGSSMLVSRNRRNSRVMTVAVSRRLSSHTRKMLGAITCLWSASNRFSWFRAEFTDVSTSDSSSAGGVPSAMTGALRGGRGMYFGLAAAVSSTGGGGGGAGAFAGTSALSSSFKALVQSIGPSGSISIRWIGDSEFGSGFISWLFDISSPFCNLTDSLGHNWPVGKCGFAPSALPTADRELSPPPPEPTGGSTALAPAAAPARNPCPRSRRHASPIRSPAACKTAACRRDRGAIRAKSDNSTACRSSGHSWQPRRPHGPGTSIPAPLPGWPDPPPA